jgi:hypothetical protein
MANHFDWRASREDLMQRRHALLGLTFVLLVIAATVASAQSVPSPNPPPRRAANEEAPDSLIGTWVMNPAKSKYAGTAPKSLTRSFDYTRDGEVLVSYVSVAQTGAKTIGHWAVSLDGKWCPEFTREWGAIPFMMISMKKVGERTFDWSYARWGRVLGMGGWTVSEDGKTLTQTVTTTSAQGEKLTNIVVYDKQE